MFNHDIGSAGFNGFEQAIANAAETRFISGSHGRLFRLKMFRPSSLLL